MMASLGRITPLAAGLFALVASASEVRAQGNTFNPYGNSGYADYREFGNPKYTTDASLPGQARLNSEPLITRPRANSFQQFTDTLDGGSASTSPTRGNATNVPYYQAYRQYDKEYDRIYRPNAKADEGFEARLRKRDQAYAKAMTEKDPARRARMLRDLEQDSLDRRPPAAARTAPAVRPAQAKAATTLSPPGASSARRSATPAPSPYPTRARTDTGRTTPAPRVGPATGRPSTPAPRREPEGSRPPDPSTIAIPPPR